MGRVDFGAIQKIAEKEGHIGGGDYLKLKEGPNRIRLLTVPLPHPGEFQGKPNFKWLVYAIDRTDGQIKVWFMAHSIFRAIKDLQQTDDFAFDDMPMPYDLQVTATGAGIERKYTVLPARKNVALTADEETRFAALKSIEEVQDAIRGKREEQREPVFAGHEDDSDLPF